MNDFILLLSLIVIYGSFVNAWKFPLHSSKMLLQSRKPTTTATTRTSSFALNALISPSKLPEDLIKPITLVVPIDDNAQLNELQTALQNLKFTSHYLPEITDSTNFLQTINSQNPYNHVYIVNANTLKEDDTWLQTVRDLFFIVLLSSFIYYFYYMLMISYSILMIIMLS